MYKIVIVDNEAIERRGISSLLHKFNYPFEITEKKNGLEALEFLTDNHINVLMTDIKMPIMDGMELAEKAHAMFPQLKIVIFSAYGEFEYAKKAIQLKVVRYILKPVVVSEFKDVMDELISTLNDDDNKRDFYEYISTIESLKSEKYILENMEYMEISDELGTQDDNELEIELETQVSVTADVSSRKVIKEVLSYIQQNYSNDLSLEIIAQSVYLSSGYLSALFKKETGQSLIKFIVAYRMEKARNLLDNTNMKIIDIGESVGYPNNSYFCTAFRSYYKKSPAKYRDDNKDK